MKRERLNESPKTPYRSVGDKKIRRGTPGLHVIDKELSALNPNPRNARVHSPRQIEQLARSIEVFGMNTPILVDAEDRIVAGHARLAACKMLGFTSVSTIALSHLTEEQIRAFIIADNRLAELAEWDHQALAVELQDLAALNLTFDLEVIGFDMGEIDVRIGEVTRKCAEPDPEDALPEPGPAVTRPGDLWVLGCHRLFCGSALEKKSFQVLMQDEKANAVFIDPPYNVPIDGHASGLGKNRHREFAMASGEMSSAEFKAFLKNSCGNLASFSRVGSIHFVAMDWRHVGELLQAGGDVYSKLLNICVWTKDNGGMGSLYRSQHEFIAVFKCGVGAHRNNVQLGQYGRNRTNVWHYPGANTLSRGKLREDLLALHPTVKPIALVQDAILDVTARNDIVLDSFLGSGTTLLAAERVGRRCRGMELDPLYVDTAIRRWQKMTKKDAILSATGESFTAAMELRHGED